MRRLQPPHVSISVHFSLIRMQSPEQSILLSVSIFSIVCLVSQGIGDKAMFALFLFQFIDLFLSDLDLKRLLHSCLLHAFHDVFGVVDLFLDSGIDHIDQQLVRLLGFARLVPRIHQPSLRLRQETALSKFIIMRFLLPGHDVVFGEFVVRLAEVRLVRVKDPNRRWNSQIVLAFRYLLELSLEFFVLGDFTEHVVLDGYLRFFPLSYGKHMLRLFLIQLQGSFVKINPSRFKSCRNCEFLRG